METEMTLEAKKMPTELPILNAKPQSFIKKWGSLIVLSLALSIVIIDTTLLNVSLGTIIREFNTTIQNIQWVITAYSLMLAAFTIAGGRIGDIFGRKKMFMLGAIIFAVGSFISSISTNVGTMIWGEAIIEGIGAALMMPATASLLVSHYKGRDRAIAFGVWGGLAGASAAIGPLLGGFLTTYYSWRWGFRINIVVAALLLLGSFLIKESRADKKISIDWFGIILSSLGLFFIVFGIIESSDYGWWIAKKIFMLGNFGLNLTGNLSITVLSLIWGIIFLLFFILWELRLERKGKSPLISMSIFSNRQFSSGIITMAVLSLGQAGLIFIFPVFYQAVRGLDAFHTGFGLLPMSLSLLVAAPLSSFIVKKISPRNVIMIGVLLNVIGYIVLFLTISPDATTWMLAPGLILYGAGMGFVIAQISNLTLSAVPVSEAGEASGINNTMRQLGSTLGAAILGAILISSISTNLSTNISSSKVLPAEVKPVIAQNVANQLTNVEFGGSTQVRGVFPTFIADEITRLSHLSISDADKTTLLYGTFFSLLTLIAAAFLPKESRESEADDIVVQGH